MRFRDYLDEGETGVFIMQNNITGKCSIALITHYDSDERKIIMRAMQTGDCIGPDFSAMGSAWHGIRLLFASLEAAVGYGVFWLKKAYNSFRRG